MKDQDKSPKELLKEFEALNKEYNSLKARYEKDITERNKAQEKLRESEERLKLAQQMAHIEADRTAACSSPILFHVHGAFLHHCQLGPLCRPGR